jgi:hypothetical protein
MWEDYFDTDAGKRLSKPKSAISDHFIDVIAPTIRKQPNDDSDGNMDEESGADAADLSGSSEISVSGTWHKFPTTVVYCPKCGERVLRSLAAHDAVAGHMTLVVPGLYLGAVWNSSNPHELHLANIGTIVCMAADLSNNLFTATIRYKNYFLEDDVHEFVIPALIDSTLFLDRLQTPIKSTTVTGQTGPDLASTTLVHCQMGKSRSVAAVIAYLVYTKQISPREAWSRVRALRPTARPNKGYLHQLDALGVLYHYLQPQNCLALVANYCPQNGLQRSSFSSR